MVDNDGGPAFPTIETAYNPEAYVRELKSFGGVTVRDYFAAKCLPTWVQAQIDASVDDLSMSDIARECYRMADAMLAGREK